MMGELTRLPNVGKKLELQLYEAGIDTTAQLRAIGSEQAWIRILAQDPSVCLLRLQALEGAVQGMPKRALPEQEKRRLQAFYYAVKKGKSD